METGVLALLGIFVLAAVCALWSFSHGRSLTRCDASQELRLVHCRWRAAGWGMLYHFTVRERPVRERSTNETANPGASHPAYLFDVRDPIRCLAAPVTLHALPPGSKVGEG